MMRDIEDMNLTLEDLHDILYYIPDSSNRRIVKYLSKVDKGEKLTTKYMIQLPKLVNMGESNMTRRTISRKKIKESLLKRLTEARTTYLHPFRKNDYYIFAGANPLPDGSAPMIYENDEPEFTVILSGSDDESNCVITILLGEDAEYAYYTPTDVDPSIAEANHIITDLIKEDNPEMYLGDPESGFERVM